MTDLQYSPNILLVMDCLWFHQAVFFTEPISLPIVKPSLTPNSQSQTSQESLSVSDLSSTPRTDEEESSVSSDTTPTSPMEGDSEVDDDLEPSYKRRPSRLSLASITTRSQSLSPFTQKTSRNLGRMNAPSPLKQSMSCKTLMELEFEEVKGFMDLGFKFKKEKLSPRMISVLPGLQRLDEYKEGKVEDLEDKKRVRRRQPYLSEAWLINRPDSPLLSWRVPRVSTSNDMKKHLKSWARTVASSIELEY